MHTSSYLSYSAKASDNAQAQRARMDVTVVSASVQDVHVALRGAHSARVDTGLRRPNPAHAASLAQHGQARVVLDSRARPGLRAVRPCFVRSNAAHLAETDSEVRMPRPEAPEAEQAQKCRLAARNGTVECSTELLDRVRPSDDRASIKIFHAVLLKIGMHSKGFAASAGRSKLQKVQLAEDLTQEVIADSSSNCIAVRQSEKNMPV